MEIDDKEKEVKPTHEANPSIPKPKSSWPDPKNLFDCLTSQDFLGWWLAARSEYLSWKKLGVFKMVDRQPSRTEACLFTRRMPCGAIAYLICFVDDCAFGAPAKYMKQIAQEVA